MKKIKWGILGLGKISNLFVQDLQLVPETEVAAVASRKLKKAQDFAHKYMVENAYGDYKTLFQDDDVDIIYIGTPHNSHAELAMEAMAHGKHVLCEKPLAVNASQVQKMINASLQNQVFLMEAFWSRFNPSIMKMLELINDGEIGDVNYVNADFSFLVDAQPNDRMLNMNLAGGSLLDMGVYPCFLPYIIFGNPEQILAMSRHHETGADIQTLGSFKYKNGMANMMSGFMSHSDMVARIYGTKGKIILPNVWHEAQSLTIVRANGDATVEETISLPTIGKGFSYEIKECLRCIENGWTESPIWSHQNSLDLIIITDEMRRQMDLKYPFEA